MALSRISNGRINQILSYNVCGCQHLSTKTKPSPEQNNSRLEEFKSKVEQGPELGDFIDGVVPRELHEFRSSFASNQGTLQDPPH